MRSLLAYLRCSYTACWIAIDPPSAPTTSLPEPFIQEPGAVTPQNPNQSAQGLNQSAPSLKTPKTRDALQSSSLKLLRGASIPPLSPSSFRPFQDALLPGPQKYVKESPCWLLIVALNHRFTYFGGPGRLDFHMGYASRPEYPATTEEPLLPVGSPSQIHVIFLIISHTLNTRCFRLEGSVQNLIMRKAT